MWHEADEDQVKYQGYLDEILANEAEARKAEEERLAAEAAQKAEEEARRRSQMGQLKQLNIQQPPRFGDI